MRIGCAAARIRLDRSPEHVQHRYWVCVRMSVRVSVCLCTRVCVCVCVFSAAFVFGRFQWDRFIRSDRSAADMVGGLTERYAK